MQARILKPFVVALTIALAIGSHTADAKPASRDRVAALPDSAPLKQTRTMSFGTSGALGVPNPIEALSRDADEPTLIVPRRTPHGTPHGMPHGTPVLSDPKLVNQITTKASAPRVSLEFASDGSGELRYSAHGVGFRILLDGKQVDEHAARNVAAVANDQWSGIPRLMRIDGDYGVDVELVDGTHMAFTDAKIKYLVQPNIVLRRTPRERRVAAR